MNLYQEACKYLNNMKAINNISSITKKKCVDRNTKATEVKREDLINGRFIKIIDSKGRISFKTV